MPPDPSPPSASTDASSDQIEGLGEDEDRSWTDYPIDTLLIRNESRTVHDVLRRIDMGSYVMDPDFQRDFIWPEDKQSKLIESVLMRIPLPVFYLAEDPSGRMIVVDGLQRLTTFHRFVNNHLPLRLPDQTDLHGKRFSDLSPKLANRVEDCNLVLYILDSKVPERAKLDIFERVNGGVPLTRQQMRNCLFMGAATRFLKEESRTNLFLEATGKSLNQDTMRDREFVNRFCAFHLFSAEAYRDDMDDFLARALKHMNHLSPDDLKDLSTGFRNSLRHNLLIFGQFAFRKHEATSTRRSLINASLWDVFSTGLASFSNDQVTAAAERIKAGFFDLMQNEDFLESITYGTNHTRQVRYRFQQTHLMLTQAINA
jgi:hypothetical protein